MPRRRCSSSNPDPTLSLTPTLTLTLTLTLSPSQALLLVCLLSDLARDGAMQVRVRDRVRN